jgi:hypothetical protein
MNCEFVNDIHNSQFPAHPYIHSSTTSSINANVQPETAGWLTVPVTGAPTAFLLSQSTEQAFSSACFTNESSTISMA